MAPVTGKRKRVENLQATPKAKKTTFELPTEKFQTGVTRTALTSSANGTADTANGRLQNSERIAIQIVTGSYDRVLHGICATLPATQQPADSTAAQETVFSNTFLFAAHASSIRCLAISPPAGQGKRLLATGSADERINVYSIGTVPPAPTLTSTTLSLVPDPAATATSTAGEKSLNRPVGTLLHHDRAVSSLSFPSRSKLFSSAEDSTVAIVRARDWTVLSTIKAPIPKPQGRPSGDTAAPGEIPAGVNSFAVHPSQKLMLSTGRRERCMRLWNLMTGKKAGVLNFDRSLLAQVGETKHSTGEGRCVRWDDAGDKFVVGFERGIAVFGIDSRPRAIARPSPPSKLHQIRFLPSELGSIVADLLAVSTEDGRLMFFDVRISEVELDTAQLPQSPCIGQLGGPASGIGGGRIKDFEVLALQAGTEVPSSLLVVTGSSDGTIRLWTLPIDDLTSGSISNGVDDAVATKKNGTVNSAPQIGSLVGTLETGNRITCLGAFVMDAATQTVKDANGQDEIDSNSGEA